MKQKNNFFIYKLNICLIFLSLVFISRADLLEDAKQSVIGGEYKIAEKQLSDLSSKDPSIENNALYQYLKGVCEFYNGNYSVSKKLLESAKSKGNGLANLYLGRLAFLNYDLDKAEEYYDSFIAYRKKLGQPAGEDVEESMIQLENAEKALERVERIIVIDSIIVPKEVFYHNYKLSPSSGKLVTAAELPFPGHRQDFTVAFLSEDNDYAIWSEPDSIGNRHLMESFLLNDGKWSKPAPLPLILEGSRNIDYPYMSGDGITLYFAADGENSIGGYDIFIAQRDGINGDFLQPLNIGMPYNSPYDDYLLAIDEENGIGWWASGRNTSQEEVTLYIYKINDIRKNYEEDDPNIKSLALLNDISVTQKEDISKLKSKLKDLNRVKLNNKDNKRYFELPVGNGRIAHSPSDFKNENQRQKAKEYLDALLSLDKKEKALQDLRKRYPLNKADNVKQEILKMEKVIENERKRVETLKNAIYK